MAIGNNPNFKLGTAEQNSVIAAFGLLIANGSCDDKVVNLANTILDDYYSNMDNYIKDYGKGNALWRVMDAIRYDIYEYFYTGQAIDSPWYGKIEDYIDNVGRFAIYEDVTAENGWLINNALYEIGTVAKVSSDPTKGNRILTQAMHTYPYLSPQYFEAAGAISNNYKGVDNDGNMVDMNKIKADGKAKYLPNSYTFDDGKMIFNTGDKVTTEKIQRLYWASKEIKAQYHRMSGNDKALEPGNADEVLHVMIYNSPDEYKFNYYLYGLGTDNGGMYIEGDGAFYTYERTPQQSIYTLEELFRHESTHYLQGRYVVPGMWGSSAIYNNNRITWYEEGNAELNAGGTRTNGIVPRKSMVSNILDSSKWFTLPQVFHSKYEDGWDFYQYSFAFMDYMYEKDIDIFNNLTNYIKANDVKGYDQYIKELSNNSELNTAYRNHLQDLVDRYNSNNLITPLVADDYLVPPTAKSAKDIYSNIINEAGLTNTTTAVHKSQFFNTFELRGTYTGAATQGQLNDWKAMNDLANGFLNKLAKDSWNGYKTLTCYFVNYSVDSSNRFQYDVVFHGAFPKQDGTTNEPPAVKINGPYTGVLGDKITFSSEGSTDSDGTMESYLWDFGDGATDTSANPTHAYAKLGPYTVTLTITDDIGGLSTESTTVTVTNTGIAAETEPNDWFNKANGPITSNTSVSGGLTLGDGQDVFYFNVTSPGMVDITVTADHTKVNWLLFKENDTDNWVAWANGQMTDTQLPGSYDAEVGKYYLKLYKFKEEDIVPYTINVTLPGDAANQSPIIKINGPYTGTTGSAITFNSEGSNDPDGTIVSYLWDFGDGTTDTSANPTHAYSKAGTYTVKLTIIDDKGGSSTESTIATVTEFTNTGITTETEPNDWFDQANGPIKNNVDVTGEFTSNDIQDIFYFNVTSPGMVDITVTADHTIVNWLLFKESNTNDYVAYATQMTDTQLIGSYDAAPGKYYLKLYKMEGDTAPYTINVTLPEDAVNQSPIVKINGPYTGTTGSAIAFSSEGSSDPDGTIASYLWDFGDGATDTSANPIHAYSKAGTYTVKLTIIDDKGAKSTESTTVTVTEVPTPIAVKGVSLNKKEINLTAGEATEKLTATVSPADAANKNITWSSDKPSVASVDSNGVITPISAGTATIKVTTADGGFIDTCTVTVSNANSGGDWSGGSYIPDQITVEVKRLQGLNRVDTAIEIAKASYIGKVSNVILATAGNYPDALSGSVLAYKLNAPILLVGSSDGDQQKVLNYMKENMDNTGTVYILGGVRVIDSAFEKKISASGFNSIKRICGANRYETAVKIADSLNAKTGTPVILVNGDNYPDALSISSIAAIMKSPILLINKDEINEAVRKKIQEIRPSSIYIIGSEGAISRNVEKEAAEIASIDMANVIRIGGANRYETSLNVAKYFNLYGQNICIATGNDFPDALAGSVYAANCNAPIILTDKDLSDNVVDYLKTKNIKDATIFGGESAVSKSIEQKLLGLIVK